MKAAPVTIVRSPADVLRLVVATSTLLVVVLIEVLFGGAVVGFASDVLRGLDAFDQTFVTVVAVAVRVTTAALLVAGTFVAIVRGRWRLLATVGVGGVVAAIVLALVGSVVDDHGGPLVELADDAGILTDATFPSVVGLSILAAVATTVGPWLPRWCRRVAWLLVVLMATVALSASPVSVRALIAVLSGWVGGAAAVALLGAPSSRPGTGAIRSALGSVGIDLADLEPFAVDARGSTPYAARTTAGDRLFVKVLGRDERSADLLFRAYRMVLPRDLGDTRPYVNLRRAVEHEALVSLSARQHGIRTPAVVALCDAEPGGVVLAYEAIAGRSLDGVDDDQVGDDVLADVWGQLRELRIHRVAHRDLRLANVFLDDQRTVWLIDFGFAELAASDTLLATDVAELTTSLALKVGAVRAVAAGTDALGRSALTAALPRLRPQYLSGATRTALKERPTLLDEVRTAIGA